jgi:prepilin peptidase CpaA
MLVQIGEVLILITISLISDIKTFKIKNLLILTFIVIGMITNLLLYGITGVALSILGFLIPILMLFILFVLRMLGAGDIKLFAAVGAIVGWKFTFFSILYSFLFGGCIGLIYLFIRKNAMKRFKYFFEYLVNCFLTLKLQDYSHFENKRDTDKFRFSYAIVPGVLTQLFLQFIM